MAVIMNRIYKTLSWICSQFNRYDILALMIVALIGLIDLHIPFHGDQAFFTVGAQEISRGKVLYRDFWDLKQPGIFYFYFLAESLFGFNEVGVHTFELLYMLGFSSILIASLKKYFKHRIFASLLPVLTVGYYYSLAGYWELTQVEALVGFPMFLALLFVSKANQQRDGANRWNLLFLSGLMGGIVLLFKFMFLLILVPFWLTSFIKLLFDKRKKTPLVIIQFVLPISLGILLPLLIVVAYFARFDSLPILYQTFFVYPPRIVSELPGAPIQRLIVGLTWFIKGFAPLIFLAAIGAYTSLRRAKDLFTLNLCLWCLLGLVVIVIQRHAWWNYHYLLPSVPLGILGTKGIDSIWDWIHTRNPRFSLRGYTIAVLSLVLLFAFPLNRVAKKGFSLAANGFALQKDQRLKYQSQFNLSLLDHLKEVEFLTKSESRPGEIYICGEPNFYLLAGREQATSLNGWAIEFFLDEQWPELVEQVQASSPSYVFIDQFYADLIKSKSAQLLAYLKQNYVVRHQTSMGTWYELK
jgi:hypothetical protein